MAGYGQCSYVRLINEHDQVHCSFVVGKARVTPLKYKTVPRMELAAATTSARMSEFMRNELEYPEIQESFWTDSRVVLGYIHNEAKRFHVYVANRVRQIRDLTDPSSWFYVNTSSNPANDASHGLTTKQLVEGSRWLTGSEFLWKSGPCKPENVEISPLQGSDPEVKAAFVLITEVTSVTPFPDHFETSRLDGVSSCYQAMKVVALCLRLKSKFQRRKVKNPAQPVTRSRTEAEKLVLRVTLPALQDAEKAIIRCLQYEHFHEEPQILCNLNVTNGETNRDQARRRNQVLRKSSSCTNWTFVDQDGQNRVGGRIRRANIPVNMKHPVIIPRKGHLTELLI